jgi:hypothetical protein
MQTNHSLYLQKLCQVICRPFVLFLVVQYEYDWPIYENTHPLDKILVLWRISCPQRVVSGRTCILDLRFYVSYITNL